MSDDLIKRSDAIDAVMNTEPVFAVDSLEPYQKTKDVVEALEAVPSADRPQGEWIEQEDCWQCSECGDEFVLEIGVKPIDARMNYCPSCGARMKGADDETNND